MPKTKATDLLVPRLEIRFGALEPKLATQLKGQGFRFKVEKVEILQHSHDAIAILNMHGFITREMSTQLHARLWREILAHLVKEN